MRLVRASSIDAPSLAMSNSGHSATKPSSSRSIIAVKRCAAFTIPSLHDQAGLLCRARRGAKAAEEAAGLPGGRLRGIRNAQRKSAQDRVELRGSGFIHGLAEVIAHRVIASCVPVAIDLLFRLARDEAEFEGDRRNTLLDEAVLITTDEAIAIGFLVGLHLDTGSFSDSAHVIS